MQQCEADREWKHQKQAATRDAYIVTESLLIENGFQEST